MNRTEYFFKNKRKDANNKQNSTCTTVINSALHYYNCRMDNIPLYLEPTNKTAT